MPPKGNNVVNEGNQNNNQAQNEEVKVSDAGKKQIEEVEANAKVSVLAGKESNIPLNVKSINISMKKTQEGKLVDGFNEFSDKDNNAKTQKFYENVKAEDLNNPKVIEEKFNQDPNRAKLPSVRFHIEATKEIDKRTKAIEEDERLSKIIPDLKEVDHGDGKGKVQSIDINQTEVQTTNNGCYSVVLSNLLKARGIEINQQMIRSYITSLDGDQKKRFMDDVEENVFDYTGLLEKLVPNTGMRKRTFDVSDVQDYYKITKKEYGEQELKDSKAAIDEFILDKKENKEIVEKAVNEAAASGKKKQDEYVYNQLKEVADKLLVGEALNEFKAIKVEELDTFLSKDECKTAKQYANNLKSILSANSKEAADELRNTYKESYANALKGDSNELNEEQKKKVDDVFNSLEKCTKDDERSNYTKLNANDVIEKAKQEAKEKAEENILKTEDRVTAKKDLEFSKIYDKLKDENKTTAKDLKAFKEQQEAKVKETFAKNKDKMHKAFQEAINNNKSAIGLNNNGHYVTVVSCTEDGFYYKQPLPNNSEGIPYKDINQDHYMSYDEFTEKMLNKNDKAIFDATWLEDYSLKKENDKVSCEKIDNLKVVKYDSAKSELDKNGDNKKVEENDITYVRTEAESGAHKKALIVQVSSKDGTISDEVFIPKKILDKGEPYKSKQEYLAAKGLDINVNNAHAIDEEFLYSSKTYASYIKSLDDDIVGHNFMADFDFKSVTSPFIDIDSGLEVQPDVYTPGSKAGKEFMEYIGKQSYGGNLIEAVTRVRDLKLLLNEYKARTTQADPQNLNGFSELTANINKKMAEIHSNLDTFVKYSSDKTSIFYNNVKRFYDSVSESMAKQTSVDKTVKNYKNAFVIKNQLKLLNNANQELVDATELKGKAQADYATAINSVEDIDSKIKEIDESDLGVAYTLAYGTYESYRDTKKQLEDELKAQKDDIKRLSEEFEKENNQEKKDELDKKLKELTASSKETETALSKHGEKNKDECLKKACEKAENEYKEKYGNDRAKLESDLKKAQANRILKKMAFEDAVKKFELADNQVKLEKGKLNEDLTFKKYTNEIKGAAKNEITEVGKSFLDLRAGLHRVKNRYMDAFEFLPSANSREFQQMFDDVNDTFAMINPIYNQNGRGNNAGHVALENLIDANGNIKPDAKAQLTKLRNSCMDYIIHSSVDKNGRDITPRTEVGKTRLQLATNVLKFCNKLEEKINNYAKVNSMTNEDLVKNAEEEFQFAEGSKVKEHLNKSKSEVENLKTDADLKKQLEDNVKGELKDSIFTGKSFNQTKMDKGKNILNFKELSDEDLISYIDKKVKKVETNFEKKNKGKSMGD